MNGPQHRAVVIRAEQEIRRAESLYGRGQHAEAARTAMRVVRVSRQPGTRSRYDAALTLALFAYAAAGEYERGWALLEQDPCSLDRHIDICYVACYLAYRRGDYRGTEWWGRRYLELHQATRTHQPQSRTCDKRHEILNTLGCAAKDYGRNDAALELFDSAIEACPAFATPYLNAAVVCRRLGRDAQAAGYIERGIESCEAKDELILFKRGVLNGRTISLCMIVRDEEQHLPGALESVQGVVDEVVIVDTGSRDRTVEIARTRGARVYHHAWVEDFAEARNHSLSYATGDWVLVLDADERLTPASAPLVRKLADTCLQDAIAFSVRNLDTDSGDDSFHPGIRMFRNRRGYDFEGIVHNQLRIPAGTAVLRAPVRIDHYGYTPSLAERRRKFERTARLLRRQLEADPGNAFAHFNLAQLLRSCRSGRECENDILHHAGLVIDLIAPDDPRQAHIFIMACHLIASAHLALGRHAEAERACRQALRIRPDYIDALLTLGHTFVRTRRDAEAREVFLEYLRVRDAYREDDETQDLILRYLNRAHEACYALGRIEEAAGNRLLALEWYRKTRNTRPGFSDTLLRIARIEAHLADAPRRTCGRRARLSTNRPDRRASEG